MLDEERTEELRGLIDARWDETLTEEQAARLQELACRDDDACRFYLDYMALHGLLVLEHAEDHPSNSLAAILAEMAGEGEDPRGGDGKSKSPVLGFLGGCFEQGASFLSKPMFLSLLLAIGLPGLVITVLVLGWTRQPPPEAYVAKITRAYDCVGTLNDPAISLSAGKKLSKGATVKLQRGLIEVTFADGARAILEERATFEVCNRNAGRLHRGRLAATVPQSAHGFTVETPAITVVDLGTDFGVCVDADRTAEAHVFGGEIEVATKGTPGNPTLWKGRLHMGQAARICMTGAHQVARIETIDASSDEFVRRFPVGLTKESVPRPEPGGTTKRLIASVDRHGGVTDNRAPIGSFDGDTDPLPSDDLGLRLGAPFYSDRLYPVEQIDEPLIGAEYVRTFNTDKEDMDFRCDVIFTTSRSEVFLMVLVDDRFEKASGNQQVVDRIVSRFANPGDFVNTGYDLDIDDYQEPHPLSAFGMTVPTKDKSGKPITYTLIAFPLRVLPPESSPRWHSNYVIAVMPEAPRPRDNTRGNKKADAAGD